MTLLFGHTTQIAAFEGAVGGTALHHAWLFVGPQGIGKASYAKQAAASLIGAAGSAIGMIAARSHPDYKIVEREVWDKATPPRIVPYDQRKDDDPPARSIRIAQVRALQPVLATRPSLSARRAILIDSVDDLEGSAANALLKNLEEPPQGTIFLLISHAPGRLLPTIRSRCRVLRFEPLSDSDMTQAMRTLLPEAPEDEIDGLVGIGEGAPGRALRYAGLDIAGLDAALRRIAEDGDRDNAHRLALGKALAGKAAQPRYEAFLDRAPSIVARLIREREGSALRIGLDAQSAARSLAEAARGLSLDAQATVIEMSGIVARLRTI